MADSVATSAFNESTDGSFTINQTQLAMIMKSEAPDSQPMAQQMVGWTVINRMKRYHYTFVSQVWADGSYAHNQPPSDQTLRIAGDLLSGKLSDISQGATHFYTPSAMPKEGESVKGMDVRGGLEQVPGVTKHGKAVKNYAPSWANKGRIYTPGIPERLFKFYRG